MDRTLDERARVIVRMMDKRGNYPAQSFMSPHAVFVAGSDSTFSAVRAQPPDKDYELAELSWASIEEIHLWAAIALSVPEGSGFLTIYPSPNVVSLDPFSLSGWDLSDKDCLEEMERALLDRRRDIDLVPIEAYDTGCPHSASPREQLRLLRSIETEEEVVWKGLCAFLKARMLFTHWAFREEAALAAYISVEAVLSALRGRVKGHEGRDVSFAEIYELIESTVRHGNALSAYLRECWESRIILAHPESRHGSWAIAPLLADDFYDTMGVLASLYRLLLINEDRPDFQEEITGPQSEP